MPIAIGAMSKALGVTKPVLEKMIENGQVVAKDVLPKFAKGLSAAAREGGALDAGMKTINAAQGRLKTSWVDFVESFSGGGGKNGIVTALETITDLLQALIPVAKVLGYVFLKIAKLITYILDPLKALQDWDSALTSGGKNAGSAIEVPNWTPPQGKPVPTSSINSNTSNTSRVNKSTNTVTLNYHSTATDSKEIRRELEDFTQNNLKSMLAPDY